MSDSEHGPGRSSFEARLQSARSRQGLDAPEAVKTAAGASDLGTGLRVGVELVSALAVAVAIGWGLDHWLHTLPLFLIIFVVLGGVAGVLNVWRTMMPRRPGQ
jgi:ATP synthase protein I